MLLFGLPCLLAHLQDWMLLSLAEYLVDLPQLGLCRLVHQDIIIGFGILTAICLASDRALLNGNAVYCRE